MEELQNSPTLMNALTSIHCLQQSMGLLPCGLFSSLSGSRCPSYVPVAAKAGEVSPAISQTRQHLAGDIIALLAWSGVHLSEIYLPRVMKEAVITVSAVDLSPAQKCLDNLFV